MDEDSVKIAKGWKMENSKIRRSMKNEEDKKMKRKSTQLQKRITANAKMQSEEGKFLLESGATSRHNTE